MKSLAVTSLEQTECGEAQNIKYEILMLKVKVPSWLETILRRAPPIFAPYPRKANTYIMFLSRIVHNVPHTCQFETPYDQKFLANVMNVHPSVRMNNARFVTVPDPSSRMLLRGERVPRNPGARKPEDEDELFNPNRTNLIDLFEYTAKSSEWCERCR